MPATGVFRRTEPAGRRAASCSGSCCMPRAGTAASPVTNCWKMNSKKLLAVVSSRSRNTPPKKGRKNVSMMRSLQPYCRRNVSVSVAGRASSCSGVRCSTCFTKARMRSLSGSVPMGAVRAEKAESGACSGFFRVVSGPSGRRMTAPERKAFQVEGAVVEQAAGLGVVGLQHLKAAVEPEAFRGEVGADAAAHGVGGVEQQHGAAGAVQPGGAGQPGHAGADDDDGFGGGNHTRKALLYGFQ